MDEKTNIPADKPMPDESGKQGGQTDVGKKGGDYGKTGGDVGKKPHETGKPGPA